MPDHILGLDIGEDSVKAVLVAGSLKGSRRIAGASVLPIREAGGLSGALEKLFENPACRGCPCVAALPADRIAFRSVTLPFRQEKKIRQTVAFALEPLLPFGIDDALVDYVVVHRGEKSDLFAAVTPRAVIRERLALLAPFAGRVEPFDIDGVAAAARLFAGAPAAGCDLLLDVGANRTVASFISRGRLIQVRVLAFGGGTVTEALAGVWGIDFEAAERKKKEGREDGAATAATIPGFLDELKKTVDYLIWQGRIEQGIARIVLTGGGALYRPLREGLSRAFSIPVTLADLSADSGTAMDPAMRTRWNPAVLNQALALALSGPRTGLTLRFSEEGPKWKAAYGRLRGDLRWAAAAAALLILLGLANVYLDYRHAQIRNDRLKAEIAALFRMYNPQATRIVDPLSQMKSGIIEARKISQGLEETRPGTTALAVLKDISALAPPGTEMMLNSFTLEKDGVLIRGQAKNLEAVETIKRELAKSKHFKTVTTGVTNLIQQGDRIEFDMQMTTKR